MKLEESTDDQLIDEIERRGMSQKHHIANMEIATFTMSHPFRCRAKGDLFDCRIHAALNAYYLEQPLGMVSRTGRYRVELVDAKLRLTPDPSYQLGETPVSGEPWILCLRCNRKSYNKNDIEQKYCGNCHIYHEQEAS